eukprot:gnl/MRDRNA2_/MRDRNA2_35283_c0_seq1.p1 gnl/MRDRNA2_/MRDRNA2_35283_c0~~gnl/MRDRNA2_/MRDRNA2_35283_c0_seq1.p1  ORF type:complete len:224 (+),score=31.92 gnl/MRDRNA2_/MRDRNA2_35283_c0_seq1:52-723(+)
MWSAMGCNGRQIHDPDKEFPELLDGYEERCDQQRCMPRCGCRSRIASRAKHMYQRASRFFMRQYYVRTYSPPKAAKARRRLEASPSKSSGKKVAGLPRKPKLVRIDSTTEIPEDIYDEMLKLAAEASTRGAHTLINGISGPFLKAAQPCAECRTSGPGNHQQSWVASQKFRTSPDDAQPGQMNLESSMTAVVCSSEGGLTSSQYVPDDSPDSSTTSGRRPLLS